MIFFLKLFSSFQLLGHVQLFVTSWTAACRASLPITNSQSLLKLLSIELVTSSNRLILSRPLLLLFIDFLLWKMKGSILGFLTPLKCVCTHTYEHTQTHTLQLSYNLAQSCNHFGSISGSRLHYYDSENALHSSAMRCIHD